MMVWGCPIAPHKMAVDNHFAKGFTTNWSRIRKSPVHESDRAPRCLLDFGTKSAAIRHSAGANIDVICSAFLGY
jgi:hypothetical protein